MTMSPCPCHHLHQSAGQTAALGGGAPARHGAHVAGGVFLTGGGDGDGVNHGAAQVSGAVQVEHADVIGDGPGVIFLVIEDLGHGDVSLVGILAVQVMASNPDSQSAGGLAEEGQRLHQTFPRLLLPVTAVAGGDDSVGSDEGSSAHEGAAHSAPEQGDLVRELPGVGLSASDNPAASTSHRGGQELGAELLGGAGGEGHEAEECECSHDASLEKY